MNSIADGCSRRCSTRPTLSQTAPTYQSTISAAVTTVSGSALPSVRRCSLPGSAIGRITTSVIGMPGTQGAAHPQRDVEEGRRLTHVERAVGGQVALDGLEDASRPRRHHDDAIGQKYCLRDR